MNDSGTAAPRRPILLGFAAFLIAFNLRPALTSIGPLLTDIAAGTGLGASGAAWLTTVPVLCLGLGGGLAGWIMRRIGIDRGILVGLCMIALGLGLRGFGEAVSLYPGTVVIGLGIGVAGVLLPALVKRDFAGQAGRVTGLYTMVLCIGAALGTGLSVPLRDGIGAGWAPALAVWALPAGLAALLWIPFARPDPTSVSNLVATARGTLLRDPLAWQVTGFMGLQSSLAYIQFGWLPAVLAGRGLGPAEAGYLSALITLLQAPGALVIGQLAGRLRDQRLWVLGVMVGTLAGFLALAFGPTPLMIPAGLILGFSSGASFALGLVIIVLRARDARDAGTLSAMAQGIGYTLASLGPLGFGLAHEATGGWALPSALFTALGLAGLACGLGAGRNRHTG